MHWFYVASATWGHLIVTNYLSSVLLGTAQYLMALVLTAPAIITLVAVPTSRRSWWRWVVLWSLLALTLGEAAMLVLIVGEASLIHRFWVSERIFGFRWARVVPDTRNRKIADQTSPSTKSGTNLAKKRASK